MKQEITFVSDVGRHLPSLQVLRNTKESMTVKDPINAITMDVESHLLK